jgi:two-component system NarL family response regulator
MAEVARIRVLVVDDHPVVRTGLSGIIDTEPDMHVVGEAGTGEEALKAFAELRPDVTLMDLRLPGASGIEVVARIQKEWPGARVIMFSSYTRDEEIYAALTTGAWSYIRKGATASELLQAIRSVHSGQRYISPEIGSHLLDHVSQDDLTGREREVLQLMSEGRSNREIGTALEISEHTVNVHVRNLMAKLGASRRTEAIATGIRKGIVRIE